MLKEYFDALKTLKMTNSYTKKQIKKHISLPLSNYALNKYVKAAFDKSSKQAQLYHYKL